jgi:hypothetical protein
MILKDIKKLVIKLCILISPIFIWIFILIQIDPFNYFNYSNIISKEIEFKTARKLNSILYNTLSFRNTPTQNIIIGDSRIKRLSINEIEKISGDKYFIIHSNAAKLNEIIDLFWLSAKYSNLENVILGINFNLFNEYAYSNRVHEIERMIANPLMYIFNGNVLEVTTKAIISHFSKTEIPNISRNIMLKRELNGKSFKDKKIWWQYNISTVAKNQYSKYKYPKKLIPRLKEVNEYCIENNINLTLLNVPHHQEFRQRVKDFNLIDEENRFKKEIKEIGTVIDYDFPNSITNCRNCFTDPIHTNDSVSLIMVKEIFNDSLVIGKKL